MAYIKTVALLLCGVAGNRVQEHDALKLQGENLISPWALLQEENENKINPCTVTEDLSADEWKAKFQRQIRAGQRPGVSHKQVIRLGTMGSGKTSSVDLFLQDHWGYGPEMFQNVELDMIVTSAKSYRDQVCDGQTMKPNLDFGHLHATYLRVADKELMVDNIVDSIQEALLDEGLSFSSEITGKTFCKLRRFSRQAFKKGYEVYGVAPYVPFYLIKQRLLDRAAKEGRMPAMGPVVNNFMKFVPRMMSMTLEVDAFFFLDNTVAFGEVPRLLLESQTDFTQGDLQKCSRRTVNEAAVTVLLTDLEQHRADYDPDTEMEIFKVERDMLTTLIAAARSQDFPECENF